MLEMVGNKVASLFSSGYDAISAVGKRKQASSVLKHEDERLKGRDRKLMLGTGRDLARNYSLISWAIRKHLDYVSQFDFQMRSDNKGLNEQVEQLMKIWSRPSNCDVAGKHSFPRLVRLAEARRVVDGDVFLMKRRNGFIQPIEADLIQNPDERKLESMRWFNGVNVNRDGKAIGYGLHRRAETGRYDFVRRVPAENIIHHAHFDRFDQVRGISPLASAFNSFRDCYEGMDFQLALMKAQSLFAMVVTSGAEDAYGDHTKVGDGYDVDFGRGPIKLEMDPGDDAKFLKTDTPGSDTQSFMTMVMSIALKALDIPYNFYDESHTNFFGSRAAWLLYDRSCIAKRADMTEMLRKITVWLLRTWISQGLLRLPAGTGVNDVEFEWIARGMPWWDPAKEINGNLMAISAGLDTPQRVCRATGSDYEDNIKEIAKAQAIAEEHGVDLNFAFSQQVASGQSEESEDDNDDDDNNDNNETQDEESD